MRFYFSAVLLGGAIFFIDPRLDLAFSALFYQPEAGFIHADLAWVQSSYRLFAWLQFPILGVLATGLLAGWFSNRWAKHQRAVWFLILALLIGPEIGRAHV